MKKTFALTLLLATPVLHTAEKKSTDDVKVEITEPRPSLNPLDAQIDAHLAQQGISRDQLTKPQLEEIAKTFIGLNKVGIPKTPATIINTPR